ncbi:uncharacterized protein LOC114521041 [Dendronephthya gigantea]|uniref:uncharacterized protein LOC114521041 n=1 Tax=Dendronephthya gigantea TaxID=151771 RepID=UPI00106D5516|nr:uncharacterized protein LOC114521041 [Dendronephthya gigantea]
MDNEPEIQYVAPVNQQQEQAVQQEPQQAGDNPAAAPVRNDDQQHELERLRQDLAKLQQSINDLSALSVPVLSKKALDYAMRPASEFNKYDALEILDTLQNSARDSKHERAEYFRLAFQMARSKIDFPHQHFQSLVLRLLGDKDQQKVFDALTKVEKSMLKIPATSRTSYARGNAALIGCLLGKAQPGTSAVFIAINMDMSGRNV